MLVSVFRLFAFSYCAEIMVRPQKVLLNFGGKRKYLVFVCVWIYVRVCKNQSTRNEHKIFSRKDFMAVANDGNGVAKKKNIHSLTLSDFLLFSPNKRNIHISIVNKWQQWLWLLWRWWQAYSDLHTCLTSHTGNLINHLKRIGQSTVQPSSVCKVFGFYWCLHIN